MSECDATAVKMAAMAGRRFPWLRQMQSSLCSNAGWPTNSRGVSCPVRLFLDVCMCVCVLGDGGMCVHSCACADLAGPLAGLLVERLGSCQNGLIDRLVGGHQQQLWLIVILTISKLIFLIYLSLHYCLLILGLGGGARGVVCCCCWKKQKGWEEEGKKGEM